MGKFDGVLICTDLDGTILRSDRTVSRENLDAIEYFKSEGGYFTFITGRMPYYASNIAQMLKPNAPFGCINGGGLYDYTAKKYIWTQNMPEGVSSLIREIHEKLQEVGIQVCGFFRTYFSKENSVTDTFRRATGVPKIIKAYDEIDEPIAKILFCTDSEDEIREVERILRAHPDAERFNFVRSERTLFEILPGGISKGVSISRLAEHLNIDIRKTVAIGDYNNDIPMFSTAGVGVAVANACEDAKAAADYITVGNEQHAIARVIYDIADGKIELG